MFVLIFYRRMSRYLYHINRFFLCVSFISLLCCNFTLGQVNKASENPDRIVLNLKQEPSTSMAVTWRTSTGVLNGFCQLQFLTNGRIDVEASRVIKAQTVATVAEFENEPVIQSNQHSLIITDLVPGKKYLYRVGTDKKWSEWFEFSTPSIIDDEFSFIYFGDPQLDIKSQWSRVVRKAYNFDPDCSFMIYGGDIINRAERDIEWDEWFKAGSFIYATVPQVLTPGNHDYNELEIDSHWNTQFHQPDNGPKGLEGSCFFVNYKNLCLISINTAAGGELEDENGYELNSQKVWLDSVLSVNTKKWVVLTTHLPFYSPKQTRDNAHIRKHFQPIIEKYGVDLVLTGHDHSYGRGTASDNPTIKPSVIYVVSVSGPKLYKAGDKEWLQQKGSLIQLFQEITINNNSLLYEAYTARGELFDKFLLKKRKTGKAKFIEMKDKLIE
jgi:3',5'-cyclic AMP phosphodiesterase CpdA